MHLHDAPAGGLRALLGDDAFHARHLGPSADDETTMLAALGCDSVEALIEATVPPAIRLTAPLALPAPCSAASTTAALILNRK